MTKRFLLELFCLFIIIFSILLVGMLSALMFLQFNFKMLFLLILILIFDYYFAFVLKRIGFEKNEIEPYVFYLQNNQSNSFEEFIKEATFFDTQSGYAFVKSKGLHLRISLLKFDSLSKKNLSSRKKALNAKINKIRPNQNHSNLSNMNRIRINFYFVHKINEYCQTIMAQNANNLFSRVEPILNVVVSEQEKIIIIPAHFGLNNFILYKRVVAYIKKLL